MKKAHIISHSHWDREWYLPYEKHHMLQVEFMDTLIDTLENDPEYKSFHLDGQTIMLEDYLQVRPEKKEALKKLVQEGRILVGPWYILQDEWLTSSEANVRNLQIGHRDAREYGDVCKVGYFPDSFGNMGQAPQMLMEAGIDTAVFGRGVKPTGFNNQVDDGNNFESQYSEMYWQSPDESKVLGVLFANWYCNGMEVPTDAEASKEYWDSKLREAEKFASTDHLLFMNGCDHQPVQTDLSEAIRVAKEINPDIEFIHSNFIDYIAEVKKDLRADLAVIKGELRSQQTEGWYTLANTASARVYLKQMNTKCQMLFEKVAEPLATMAFKNGMPYPHHLFVYGWKLLMQNHPHDSICGCSVDDVHREMVTRFEKAENVALHIIDEAMTYLADRIDVSKFTTMNENAKPFFVVNSTGFDKNGVVDVVLEVAKHYFRDCGYPGSIKAVKEHKLPKFKIVDENGVEVPGTVEEIAYRFNYDLPKDKFRQPYMANRVKVTLEVENIPQFGWKTFALIPVEVAPEKSKESLFVGENEIENETLKVKINSNGSLDVTHKASGKTFVEQGIYEDLGDIGNEYIYMMPIGDTAITTKNDVAKITVLEDSAYRAVVQVENNIEIPVSADEKLHQEMQDLVEFRGRKAQRSKELTNMTILTTYTVERLGKGIKVKSEFVNEALDHRLRALFKTDITTPYHYADSIFEVAKRDNMPSSEWQNPCNAQHQQAFINIHDEACGLTVANKGLNEYEVLRDEHNTIAVTLLRAVGELGDWGVFETPEAQCLGKQAVEFEIIPHGADEDLYNSYKEAYAYQVSDFVKIIDDSKEATLPVSYSMLQSNNDVMWSSLKVNEETQDVIGRWYDVSGQERELTVNTDMTVYRSNLLEEVIEEGISNIVTVKPYKIVTLGMK